MLLMLTILLLLGIALLSSRAARYRSATEAIRAAQAQALAEAGLADARMKLDKRQKFPPQGKSDEQMVFSYVEDLTDPAGNPVGSYAVTVDRRWNVTPYNLIFVTSVGLLGEAHAPTAKRKISVELDTGTLPSEIINRVDHGGI